MPNEQGEGVLPSKPVVVPVTGDDSPLLRVRVRRGLRRPRSWLQLARFVTVGASGYVVNLATFALIVSTTGAHFRVAATAAFLVAVTNNFLWNRRWTFRVSDGRRSGQAVRFGVVSVGAFLFNLAVLSALVEGFGVSELPAQAVAIIAATPLSFVGNKLWTFAR
jgi:dolichol-phosphate mannosyltransferase